MSFNIKFKTSEGYDQITDVYKNYRIIQSGTATTGTLVTFPTQTIIPLVMVRPPYGKSITAGFAYYPSGADTITKSNFVAYTPGNYWIGLPPVNYSYSYVVLVPVAAQSTDPWAMRVWDSSSNILFDSGYSFPTFDNITNAAIANNFTITGWSGTAYRGVWPYNGSITITVTTPSFGNRYLLLNQLKSFYEVLSDDGVDGTDVMDASFCGILNSESSVTYKVSLTETHESGTPMGSVLYFYMNNAVNSLLTGTVNI